MTTLSACFIGPRESRMPYAETSAEYGKLELVLKAQIIKLIRMGVSEFYTGGQTGIDTLAAMLVISIRQELMTTANLNLVLPHRNMAVWFSTLQKDNFDWIKRSADTVMCLNERYTPGCYRRRSRYMVEKKRLSDCGYGCAEVVQWVVYDAGYGEEERGQKSYYRSVKYLRL